MLFGMDDDQIARAVITFVIIGVLAPATLWYLGIRLRKPQLKMWGVVIGVTYVLLKLVSAFVPLRVSREHELEGLDISQHGEALQ